MSVQRNLFDTDQALVRLPDTAAGATLSKVQKTFKRLIQQIESQRELLARWQAVSPLLDRRIATEYRPQHARLSAARFATARRFDAALDEPGFTKRERSKLIRLVQEICAELIETPPEPDPAVIALHDKHSERSHAEMQEASTAVLKDLAESVLGVELTEAAASPQELLEALQEKMRAQTAPRAEAKVARERSAKALAREAEQAAKREAEALAATHSVREIYRKLASSLHPDREPDVAERERKTALMKSVNLAYEKRDLLRLLELQLQIEQIDLAHLGKLADARLAHYNKVLTEQSQQLAHELELARAPYCVDANPLRVRAEPTPEQALHALTVDIAGIKREAAQVERELAQLADRLTLKHWLRSVRMARAPDRDPDDDIDAFLGNLMSMR